MDKEIQELNEKLARWRGFEKHWWSENVCSWLYPDGSEVCSGKHLSIDFTTDLNACFKWLVPELLVKCHIQAVYFMLTDWIYQVLYDKHKEPALALCRVIEQVIDD